MIQETETAITRPPIFENGHLGVIKKQVQVSSLKARKYRKIRRLIVNGSVTLTRVENVSLEN